MYKGMRVCGSETLDSNAMVVSLHFDDSSDAKDATMFVRTLQLERLYARVLQLRDRISSIRA